MTIIRNNTPILKANGTPAIGNVIRVYRRDTGELIGYNTTSGSLGVNYPVSWPLGADNTGWSGYTLRILVDKSLLIPGNRVRATFSAASGASAMIGSAYVGNAATSGDLHDFDSTPSQLLFGLSPGTTVSAGTSLTSDWCDFNYDLSKNLVISVYFSGSTSVRTAGNRTGWTAYYSAGDTSATVNPPSYTLGGMLYCISKIEINDSTLTNGYYIIPCGSYTDEVSVVCLDNTGTQNDLIRRAFPT